jgi:hypothetical protein
MSGAVISERSQADVWIANEACIRLSEEHMTVAWVASATPGCAFSFSLLPLQPSSN